MNARAPHQRSLALLTALVLALALLRPAGLAGCSDGPASDVHVDFTLRKRVVPPFLFGQNLQTIENGEQVIAADGSLDPEIVKILGDARITTLRFPGGTQADHFVWWQALGPPSGRALQASGNLDELYRPVIGPEELIELAKALRAVPFITANTGSGSAALAGAWAQYFNAVGFPVTFWEIGNEPYFLGINGSGVLGLTPDAYAAKVIEYATAIRSQVPGAKIFGAGVIGPADTESYWNSVMLGIAGPYLDGLSLHNAYAPLYAYTPGPSPVVPPEIELYRAMMGASKAFERTLRVVSDELARNGRLIPIFVTEYDGIFYPEEKLEPPSVTLARNPTLACALYNASVLQVMMRNERVHGAHHMSLAGRYYGSLVGVDHDARFRNPQFYVQREYAKEADHIVVDASVDAKSAVFDTLAVREIPGQTGVPDLDVLATRDAAGGRYALFVVNRHLTAAVTGAVTTNLPLGLSGSRSVLTGPRYDARNDATEPERVSVVTTPWTGDATFTYVFPPSSLTIFRWSAPAP